MVTNLKIKNLTSTLHDTQGITLALIMDDPDAMAAVGKVWVHWLQYWEIIGGDRKFIDGKT